MNKQKWIEIAAEKGLSAFEIYQELSSERNVTWYAGQMDTFVTSRVLGTALRGIYEGKMANLALEKAEDEDAEKLIDQLIEQAKTVSTKETDTLRAPEEVTPLPEKKLVQPTMDEIACALKTIEEKAKNYDERILQVSRLSWSEEASRREITNSLGMDVADETHTQVLMLGLAASANGEVKVDYNLKVVPNLAELDVDAFVKESCDGAIEKLGATSLPSKMYNTIIERKAMTSLFAAFSGMFSGDLIFKGISPLKDSLGEEIFSEKITIIDDPASDLSIQPVSFDDEGCPTRRKVLVEKGVFKEMLQTTKSAARFGKDSTGNGFKRGYASAVAVSPMNCYIAPGEKSLDELQDLMGEGVVITSLQGLHAGINPVTTDFSLQCSGYYVKDGKKDHSVSLITIAGNLIKMLKNVKAVGSDLDFEYRSIATPSIYVGEAAISGE